MTFKKTPVPKKGQPQRTMESSGTMKSKPVKGVRAGKKKGKK